MIMGKIADLTRGLPMSEQQRRKIVTLDQEFVSLEAKVKTLEAEKLHLEKEINPLKREIERLQQQVKKESAAVHNLEATEIEMMQFIGNKKSVTASDIASGMNMHSVPVEHFLGRLLKAQYVVQSQVPMVGAMYSLDDKGNAYLVEKKLVPLTGRQAEQPSNPDGYHCDHCGSQQLKRIGNRADPMFAEVGIKQAVFSCLSCGKESAFTQEPR